jgi:hypothetical protein
MNTDHTLEEVGQQFSVTRERIRQIEAKALRMWRAQPVRGTSEHDAGASEPEPEDAELFGSVATGPFTHVPCLFLTCYPQEHKPTRIFLLHLQRGGRHGADDGKTEC